MDLFDHVVRSEQELRRLVGTPSQRAVPRDPGVLDLCVAQGKTPLLAIGVEVEECFLHCAKAFCRATLWSRESWPAPDALPSMACVLFDQIKPDGLTVHDYEHSIEEGYRTLY